MGIDDFVPGANPERAEEKIGVFLEKEFKCKVQVIPSYRSSSQKALRAEPGKPGIEVIS